MAWRKDVQFSILTKYYRAALYSHPFICKIISSTYLLSSLLMLAIKNRSHSEKNHCPLPGLIHLIVLRTAYILKISSSLHAFCSGSCAAAHLMYLIRCSLYNGKGIGLGLIGLNDIYQTV